MVKSKHNTIIVIPYNMASSRRWRNERRLLIRGVDLNDVSSSLFNTTGKGFIIESHHNQRVVRVHTVNLLLRSLKRKRRITNNPPIAHQMEYHEVERLLRDKTWVNAWHNVPYEIMLSNTVHNERVIKAWACIDQTEVYDVIMVNR